MDSTASAILAATAPAPARGRERHDPLALILGTGESWSIFSFCVAVALVMHAGMLVFALVSSLLKDMHDAVVEDRARIHDYFFRLYDVEVAKPKEPPPPEPPPPEPPPPEPVVAPKPMAKVQEDDPYKNLPPTPAKAAAIVTAAPKDDEPVALDGFVTGDGTALGGIQSGAGTGDRVTMQRNAAINGVPGGKGTATAAAPPPPVQDLSAPPGILGETAWKCPFPPEADSDQIDQATVQLIVTVRADGSPLSVSIVSDPGHGFGRAARVCALSKHYKPGLDKTGQPMTKTTPPINVRFNR